MSDLTFDEFKNKVISVVEDFAKSKNAEIVYSNSDQPTEHYQIQLIIPSDDSVGLTLWIDKFNDQIKLYINSKSANSCLPLSEKLEILFRPEVKIISENLQNNIDEILKLNPKNKDDAFDTTLRYFLYVIWNDNVWSLVTIFGIMVKEEFLYINQPKCDE